MKGLFRFMKLAIVKKDYARLLCFASIILYVVSLPMHTGIGVETGREDFTGLWCLTMGWMGIIVLPYFLLWISNLIFIYTVCQLWRKMISERTLALIFASFISTIIYIFFHRLSWEHDYRNYACYIWSLSYMLALWASVLEREKGELSTKGKKWISVLFTVFGIGIMGLLSSELKYYHDLYGKSINPNIEEYRINNKGVYYTFHTKLLKESFIDYLKGANADSMVVLNKRFAKDNLHVWNDYDLVKGVDVASFTVSKTGVPKDKEHVYWLCYFERERESRYVPVSRYIDVATAEYFIDGDVVHTGDEYDEKWIRDSRHVFLNGCMLRGIDAETFKEIGYDKFQDKNGTYNLNDLFKLRVKDEEITDSLTTDGAYAQ